MIPEIGFDMQRHAPPAGPARGSGVTRRDRSARREACPPAEFASLPYTPIVAAGLEPRVTFCAALVPALCDHYGYLAGRANGWPRFIELDQSGQPAQADVVATAQYFDGVNFAARIKAEAIFTAGFIDNTCCPSSVYAAYNRVPGRKTICNNPRYGHQNPPAAVQAVDQAIEAHVRAWRARQ